MTLGARGLEGRAFGATGGPGSLGLAAYFESPGACVDLGDLPSFAPREGVRIEALVLPGDFAQLREEPESGVERRPRPPAPGRRPEDLFEFEVAGKGDAYFLRIREDYAIVGGVRGENARAPHVRETAPGAVVPGRWAEVELIFDGADLRLLVNGLRQDLPVPANEATGAAAKPPKAIALDAAPLTISSPHPGLCFFGAIDEVRILGIAAEEGMDVGPEVAIDAPESVRFDARGELDALYHQEPVKIAVSRTQSGKRAALETATGTALRIIVEKSGALR